MGGKFHDKLEEIINNKDTEAALPAFLRHCIADADMLGLSFPRDFRGRDTIRQGWIADMTHFCDHFVKPSGSFQTEDFFLHELAPGRYIQGYIDLIRLCGDGRISIYDWKTSSKFSKEDLLHHGRQLIVYAYAKERQGFPVKEIAWIMLKYAVVSFMGCRRGSKKLMPMKRVVRRGRLVAELRDYLLDDLSRHGYHGADRRMIYDAALRRNSLDLLPKAVSSNYAVRPYVLTYPYTAELVDEALGYINEMADLFERLPPDDEKRWLPRKFVTDAGKEDTFYCNVLCSFRYSCRHIEAHRLHQRLEPADYSDMF